MRDFTESDPSPPPNLVSKLWGAYVTHDDGKRGPLIGLFTQESDAKVAAHKRGAWGDGDVAPVFCVRVGSQAYLLASSDPVPIDVDIAKYKAEIRAAALEKLNDAEKAVLGLK